MQIFLSVAGEEGETTIVIIAAGTFSSRRELLSRCNPNQSAPWLLRRRWNRREEEKNETLHRAKHHITFDPHIEPENCAARETDSNQFFFSSLAHSPLTFLPIPFPNVSSLRGFKTKIYVPIGAIAVCSWLRNEIFAETERKIAIEICGAFRLTESILFFFFCVRVCVCFFFISLE